MMKAIVAVDRNWAIGKDGSLLTRIPADQRYFRAMTEGSVVIMGRKTLESFPGGRPLKNRVNIVITRNPDYRPDGVTVVGSVEKAAQEALRYAGREVFVIGGGEIYREMLPYCDTAYVTKIDYSYDADTTFPSLDECSDWEIAEEGEEQTSFDLIFTFVTYRRKSGGTTGR